MRISTFLRVSCLFIVGLAGVASAKAQVRTDGTAKSAQETLARPQYMSGTALWRLKESYRSVCLPGRIDDAKVMQQLVGLGVTRIERMFPNQKPNARFKSDLTTVYRVHFDAALPVLEVVAGLDKIYVTNEAIPSPIFYPCFTPSDTALSGHQYNVQKVDGYRAWDLSKGDSNVVIAIVDGGYNFTHPDLAGKNIINHGEIPGNRVDDDHDGYVDNYRGWDFGGANALNPTPDNDPSDRGTALPAGHGVHVAGIAAAATNNSIGIAGMGYDCRLLPIKVASDNYPGAIVAGFEGIEYAASHGAHIINCSWGGAYGTVGIDSIIDAVINNATDGGALIVAAAGNSGTEDPTFLPAAHDRILSVGATGTSDTLTSFSTYSPRTQVSAPGNNIVSTFLGTRYISISGTSMASPLVAGIAGLVKAYHPSYTPEQIAAAIEASAQDFNQAADNHYPGAMGRGRVNAYRALGWEGPGIELVRYDLGDTLLYSGDTIRFKGVYHNRLATPQTGVTATVRSTTAWLRVVGDSVFSLGRIAAGSQVIQALPVRFRIEGPEDVTGSLQIVFKDSDTYQETVYVPIYLNPASITITAMRVATTLFSTGRMGRNEYGNGRGTVSNSSTINLDGGVLSGSDAQHFYTNARNSYTSNRAEAFAYTDFTSIQRARRLPTAPGIRDVVESVFQPQNATGAVSPIIRQVVVNTEPVGSDDSLMGVVKWRITHTLRNTGSQTLTGYYHGLSEFMILTGADVLRMDTTLRLATCSNTQAGALGFQMLDQRLPYNFAWANPYAPTVGTANPALDVADGFTRGDYFTAATAGRSMVSSLPRSGVASYMLTYGPLIIPAGDSIVLPFALYASARLDSVQAIARHWQISRLTATAPALATSVRLYPNPATQQLTIEGVPPTALYEVATLSGAVVQKGNLIQGHLPLAGIENGLYILTVEQNGRKQRVRFVKQ